VLFKITIPLRILTDPTPLTFTAPFKVVVPLPVVCTKLLAVIAPAVTLLAELIVIVLAVIALAVTLLAELIVIAPSCTGAPTAPVNTTFPAVPAVNPRVWAPADVPFSVLAKVTVAPAGDPPALVVSTNTPPVSVVAEL
jgi:hypothetical protein